MALQNKLAVHKRRCLMSDSTVTGRHEDIIKQLFVWLRNSTELSKKATVTIRMRTDDNDD